MDDESAAGWEWLRRVWEGALDGVGDGADVNVVLGLQARRREQSEKEALERTEWALDHGVELLSSQLEEDRAAAAAAAAATRGEAPRPKLAVADDGNGAGAHDGAHDGAQEDAEGLVRLVEALQCRMWTPLGGDGADETVEALHGEHCRAVEERLHRAAQRARQPAARPQAGSSPATLAEGAAAAKARREELLTRRDQEAERYLQQMAGAEPEPEPEPEPEAPPPAPKAAPAAGGGVAGRLHGLAAGLAREGTLTPNAIAALQAGIPDPQPAAAGGGAKATSAHEAANAGGGGGGGDDEAYTEREAESVEQLLEKIAFLRDKGGTLSDDARREQATSAALAMAKLFGEEEGDDDDDEGDAD